MQLGISTACFYPQTMEDAITQIASVGVHTAECFFNTESEFETRYTEQLVAVARAHDVRIISLHPYSSLMEGLMLFSDYKRRTEDGMMQYQRYFETAACMGARYITFHGERDMGAEDERRQERRIETYHRLCALAQACGVTLAQENVAWCKSGDPAFIRMLREQVPELHFTLDIKQARRAGHDPMELLQAMGDRLVNVHLNDHDEKHTCLLPGEGTMDYETFFSALRALGYDRQVMIEVYRANFETLEQMRRAVAFLHPFISEKAGKV